MRQPLPPTHIFRPGRAKENLFKLSLILQENLLAHINIIYSTKTNDHPLLLKELADAGASLECTSELELKQAENHASQTRLTLAGPAWTLDFLRYAIRSEQVKSFVVDGATNASLLAEALREVQHTTQRIYREIQIRLHDGDSHFGVPVQDRELGAIVEKFAQIPHLTIGLHIHRNSDGSFKDLESFRQWFQDRCRRMKSGIEILQRLVPDQQYIPLNFGGGIDHEAVFRVPSADLALFHNPATAQSYRATHSNTSAAIMVHWQLIGQEIQRLIAHKPQRFKISMELGRALASNTFDTQISILGVKETLYPEGPVYLTNGNTGILGPIHRQIHRVNSSKDTLGPERIPSFVYGNLPHSGDWLFYSLPLPRLAIGDSLLIEATGAYYIPMQFGFGHQLPEIIQH